MFKSSALKLRFWSNDMFNDFLIEKRKRQEEKTPKKKLFLRHRIYRKKNLINLFSLRE